MRIYKQLSQYFDYVINTKEFIIVIDSTGVYLFKEIEKNNTTIKHAKKLLQVLALEENEAKMIFVIPESDIIYDSFTYEESSVKPFVLEVGRNRLEDLVRKVTGVRNSIFNKADIESIVDCFQDVVVELTDFQKQLCELGLSEQDAIAYEMARPDSINDLIELGCPPDIVEDVYAAFMEYYVQRNIDIEKLDSNNYVTIDRNMRRYRTIGGLVSVLSIAFWIASMVLTQYQFYLSIVVCLLGVVAINMISKSINLKDSTVARIFLVVDIALLCIVIVPPAGKWIVDKFIKLIQGINLSVTKNWFEYLHW